MATGRPPSHRFYDLPTSLSVSPVDFGRPDLPVLGRAQGGATGVLMIPTEQPPVDWTYRPPQLRGVSDAFDVFATTTPCTRCTSMVRRCGCIRICR